jgi:hypothetical protein
VIPGQLIFQTSRHQNPTSLIKTPSCKTRLHVQVVKSDLDPAMNFNSTSTQRQRLMQRQKLWQRISTLKTIWLYAPSEHAVSQPTQYPNLSSTSRFTTLSKITLRQRLGQ